MKDIDNVADDFVEHLSENAGGYIDPTLIHESAMEYENWSSLLRSLCMADPEIIGSFVEAAGPTLRWLERIGLKFEFLPTAFLTTTTTRLLPVGGGLAIVDTLTAKAKELDVDFLFETSATGLEINGDGSVTGLEVRAKGGTSTVLSTPAIVLACGGFQGNPYQPIRPREAA